MTRPGHEPERTCVGCRRRAPVGALARLALRDGRLVVWGPGAAGSSPRPPGRGAALHAEDTDCLRAALATGAFARAFNRPGSAGKLSPGNLDEADLVQQLTAASAASLRRE